MATPTARQIIAASSRIWDKHGWQSGKDVDFVVLRDELIQAIPKILETSEKVLDKLTDLNYHSEREIIEEIKGIRGSEHWKP